MPTSKRNYTQTSGGGTKTVKAGSNKKSKTPKGVTAVTASAIRKIQKQQALKDAAEKWNSEMIFPDGVNDLGLTRTRLGHNAPVHLSNIFCNLMKNGVGLHQRFGEEVFVDRLRLRFLMENALQYPNVHYRIIIGMHDQLEDFYPTCPLLVTGQDTNGTNQLVRSVDFEKIRVIKELTIQPSTINQNINRAVLADGLISDSTDFSERGHIEEIVIPLKKNLSFIAPTAVYGSNNLCVWVLAYANIGTAQDTIVSRICCEATIFWKEP